MKYLIVLTVLAACNGGVVPKACTLIGCNDGLRVQVMGAAAQSAVTVKAGDRVLNTFTCTVASPCETFIPNEMPAAVTIQVSSGGQVRDFTVTPAYRDTRPNGPGCEPVCRQATATVTI